MLAMLLQVMQDSKKNNLMNNSILHVSHTDIRRDSRIIKELKVEGKKKMKTRDLLNGFRISDNSYVK